MFNCCGSKTSATTLHLNITFFASSYFLYKVAHHKSPYDADGWKTVPEGLTQFLLKKKEEAIGSGKRVRGLIFAWPLLPECTVLFFFYLGAVNLQPALI